MKVKFPLFHQEAVRDNGVNAKSTISQTSCMTLMQTIESSFKKGSVLLQRMSYGRQGYPKCLASPQRRAETS